MTDIEIETFKDTIIETIMPNAKNMNIEQIQNIIKMVIKDNPQMTPAFGDLLLEQILIMKNN